MHHWAFSCKREIQTAFTVCILPSMNVIFEPVFMNFRGNHISPYKIFSVRIYKRY